MLRLTPIACALLTLYASPLWAAGPVTPQPASGQDDGPTTIQASQVNGVYGQTLEADGPVEMKRPGQTILADWLRYQQATEDLYAKGHIRLLQHGDDVRGDELKLNLNSRIGNMTQAEYVVANGSGRGKADVMEFAGRDRYHLKNATYSSCVNPEAGWYLIASDLSLDYTRNLGEAESARLVFQGVPLAYLPWFDFSLNGERKSGWLTPSIGHSSQSGAELSTPYYWNIAPNRDATFTPRLMQKRGLQLKGEFRYLEPDYAGEVTAEWLSDRKSDRNRSGLKWLHQQRFGAWDSGIRVERVSDDTYFEELGDKLAVSSTVNLPREAWISRSENGLSFSARFLKYQTLQPNPNSLVDPPYAKLPQLTLNWLKPNLGGGNLDLDLQSEFTAFRHRTKVDGTRLVAYPSVSWLLSSQSAYFKPKIGVHFTHYNINAANNRTGLTNANRTVPILSVDSGLFFDRETTLGGQNYTQTLEPRLYYVNIPYRDQSRLPNFDSGLADFSFAQLFSENRYTGSDRINEANQVTAAVTSRLIDDDTGVERLRASIGQRYYLRKTQRVALDGSTTPRNERSSDILASLEGQLGKNWHLSSSWQFNTSSPRSQKASLDLQYSPGPGKVLNFGYRMDRTPAADKDRLKQFDISGQWPIATGWYGVARWNYSLKDKKPLEVLAGVEYNAGCWQLRMVAQRFVTSGGNKSTNVFLLLQMSDVASFGSNPSDTLKRGVKGYAEPERLESANPTEVKP